MKHLVVTTGEFLLLLLAWGHVVVSSPPSCSRTPPSHTDCSTANNECIHLYDESDPSTPVSLLPYPLDKYVHDRTVTVGITCLGLEHKPFCLKVCHSGSNLKTFFAVPVHVTGPASIRVVCVSYFPQW